MLPFRHIIFPVDYSDRCRALAPAVDRMAAFFGIPVTLVHSFQVPVVVYGEFMPLGLPSASDWASAQEKAIEKFAKDAFPNRKVDAVVAPNVDAGAAIESVVRRTGADLVMLGTSGHGPIRRLLGGSVVSKVLHDLSCAVWTAPQPNAGPPYQHVLCAVSAGDEAATVVRAAAAIARTFHATLSVVHAVEPDGAALEAEYVPYRKQRMDSAEAKLREILREQELSVPLTVSDGGVATVIKEEAVDRAADLIVTGRGHAQGAVSRLWSHLSTVVREAPCPVLSV